MNFAALETEGGPYRRLFNPLTGKNGRGPMSYIEDYVRIEAPFSEDHNHNNIGVFDTVMGWDAASSLSGLPALTGVLDLRDRNIVVEVRSFVATGGVLALFVQSIMDRKKITRGGRVQNTNHVSVWYNDRPVNLRKGQWSRVSWKGPWKQAGNNPLWNSPEWQYTDEYTWEQAFSRHKGTLALAFVGGDGRAGGFIDVRSFFIE